MILQYSSRLACRLLTHQLDCMPHASLKAGPSGTRLTAGSAPALPCEDGLYLLLEAGLCDALLGRLQVQLPLDARPNPPLLCSPLVFQPSERTVSWILARALFTCTLAWLLMPASGTAAQRALILDQSAAAAHLFLQHELRENTSSSDGGLYACAADCSDSPREGSQWPEQGHLSQDWP